MRYNTVKILALSLMLICIAAGCNKNEKEEAVLKWAADVESGAPYVFQNPDNPKELIGFEVEIIDAVTKELGMKSVHVQQQWDGLIPGLGRNDYDVVINGIEITPDRQQVVNFSRPYFATYLQLAVKAEENSINDITQCRGKAVGTLSGCFAERYMTDSVGGIDVKGYESEANAYLDMKNGRLDAVFIDYPVAKVYAQPDPAFKFVGGPVGVIQYGIVVKKEDTELLNKIDQALLKLWKSGEIKKILIKWELWDTFLEKYNPFTEGSGPVTYADGNGNHPKVLN